MENIEKQRKEGTEMKKAYIFDLDGTLVDSIPTISHFANQALLHYGCKPVEKKLYKLFLGEGSAKLVHRLLDSQGKDTEENFEKVHTKETIRIRTKLLKIILESYLQRQEKK